MNGPPTSASEIVYFSRIGAESVDAGAFHESASGVPEGSRAMGFQKGVENLAEIVHVQPSITQGEKRFRSSSVSALAISVGSLSLAPAGAAASIEAAAIEDPRRRRRETDQKCGGERGGERTKHSFEKPRLVSTGSSGLAGFPAASVDLRSASVACRRPPR